MSKITLKELSHSYLSTQSKKEDAGESENVKAGQIITVLGPSGCGKTTLVILYLD